MDTHREHEPLPDFVPGPAVRPEAMPDGNAWGTEVWDSLSGPEGDAFGPDDIEPLIDEPATIVDLDDDEVIELAQGVHDAVVRSNMDSLDIEELTDQDKHDRKFYLAGIEQGSSQALATFLRAMDAMADAKAARK